MMETKPKTFFDMVNEYNNAVTVREIDQTCSQLLQYVTSRLKNVHCYIENNKLWILPKDNSSLSTSIISSLLGIEAKNIDDSAWSTSKWSISLHRR